MEEKNRIRGKKARSSGNRFELRVRKDLEASGWIVDRWSNNVEFQKENSTEVYGVPTTDGKYIYGKVIPAKRKFNPFMKVMSIGTGFPDFVAFTEFPVNLAPRNFNKVYEVIGVEVKSNGYLDPEERAKCKWYLDSKIFSKILIAKKSEKRGKIDYVEFKKENI